MKTIHKASPDDVRLIAIYLPQFHPIPENDKWWGRGFTEWTNVAKASPQFPGHHQPKLPGELGFYDLRLPEVRHAQAALAMEHGISGFCYYHYWFNGRRLLERPFDEVLSSGQPDFPFCLCWANENWTRTWDGRDREVLLEQHYSLDDDREHIRSLIPAFADPRYIRIDGKPLFIVYRTELLPDPAATAAIWREEARCAGLGELYLCRFESMSFGVDPRTLGFDAAIEFAPDWRNRGGTFYSTWKSKLALRMGLLPSAYSRHNVYDYRNLVKAMCAKETPDYPFFRCVSPGFDSSSRRKTGATIFKNSTPERYEQWLRTMIAWTREHRRHEERIVFLNAWNEWAEGNYLEPDAVHGRTYLEATRSAARNERSATGTA